MIGLAAFALFVLILAPRRTVTVLAALLLLAVGMLCSMVERLGRDR